jgi:hypothetical protein
VDHRVHLFGAAGSGTTTLGTVLAQTLGVLHLATDNYFLRWARSYDTAAAPIRSLDLHETWMQRLPCPVLRLDSRQSVGALVDVVTDERGVAVGAR